MPRRVRFTEEETRAAVAASRSFSEVLRRLGMRPAGGNHATIKKYVAAWGIDTSHFDPHGARLVGLRRTNAPRPLAEILVEHSTYSRGHLKERLFREGLKQRACELCGQGETWRGRPMALILDHVNGVADDHRLENLRVLCPNCNATLDTHCGRQNARERACKLCGATFRPKYRDQRHCSRACGARAPSSRAPRPHLRKVPRPPYTHLVREVHALGWEAVGRRYGVSGNAVRKWVRQYERERSAQGGEEVAEVGRGERVGEQRAGVGERGQAALGAQHAEVTAELEGGRGDDVEGLAGELEEAGLGPAEGDEERAAVHRGRAGEQRPGLEVVAGGGDVEVVEVRDVRRHEQDRAVVAGEQAGQLGGGAGAQGLGAAGGAARPCDGALAQDVAEVVGELGAEPVAELRVLRPREAVEEDDAQVAALRCTAAGAGLGRGDCAGAALAGARGPVGLGAAPRSAGVSRSGNGSPPARASPAGRGAPPP
ncbi:MAG: HNH endonuclease [Solirubrobacterales bacterium]|nr:HNH endonuclease [Solirubrobacterales bacterium]